MSNTAQNLQVQNRPPPIHPPKQAPRTNLPPSASQPQITNPASHTLTRFISDQKDTPLLKNHSSSARLRRPRSKEQAQSTSCPIKKARDKPKSSASLVTRRRECTQAREASIDHQVLMSGCLQQTLQCRLYSAYSAPSELRMTPAAPWHFWPWDWRHRDYFAAHGPSGWHPKLKTMQD